MGRQVNNICTLNNELDFNLVFKKGKIIKPTAAYVKATYLFVDDGEAKKVKTAVAVPSKFGNSVWRNRFKRLIRESVRRESKKLLEIISKTNSNLLIVYSPHKISLKNKKKLKFNEILPDVINIINAISEKGN